MTVQLKSGAPLIRDGVPSVDATCCDCIGADCEGCGSNGAPLSFTITFTGIGAGSVTDPGDPQYCGSCGDLNGSFVLTPVTVGPICDCTYRYEFDPDVCGKWQVIQVAFCKRGPTPPNNYEVDIQITGTSGRLVRYGSGVENEFNCVTMNRTGIPFVSDNGGGATCDFTSSSCNLVSNGL